MPVHFLFEMVLDQKKYKGQISSYNHFSFSVSRIRYCLTLLGYGFQMMCQMSISHAGLENLLL